MTRCQTETKSEEIVVHRAHRGKYQIGREVMLSVVNGDQEAEIYIPFNYWFVDEPNVLVRFWRQVIVDGTLVRNIPSLTTRLITRQAKFLITGIVRGIFFDSIQLKRLDI